MPTDVYKITPEFMNWLRPRRPNLAKAMEDGNVTSLPMEFSDKESRVRMYVPWHFGDDADAMMELDRQVDTEKRCIVLDAHPDLLAFVAEPEGRTIAVSDLNKGFCILAPVFKRIARPKSGDELPEVPNGRAVVEVEWVTRVGFLVQGRTLGADVVFDVDELHCSLAQSIWPKNLAGSIRHGMVVQLTPDKRAEYRRLHADVWSSVLRTIEECNIRNYSIFVAKLPDGNDYLFSYYEYIGDDHAADMAKMAADEETQRWWKLCTPLQQPIRELPPGEVWAQMEEVFHHSGERNDG
jgi:L-rhamnose mutarotase